VSPETLAAQALGEADPVTRGLAPVINPSTNYERQADGSYRQDRQYTRADNPTFEHAERLLAALEGAGCACALFASGMAAATAVFQSLPPGDHVLVSRVLHWGVRKWLAEFGLTWGLDVEFTDTCDLAAVKAAIRPGRTRLIWAKTPANPMWEITDLAAVCALAHSAGVRVAVDNTVATPGRAVTMDFRRSPLSEVGRRPMVAATDTGFVRMRVSKVVGLQDEDRVCEFVVLNEPSDACPTRRADRTDLSWRDTQLIRRQRALMPVDVRTSSRGGRYGLH
jgi:hypothetical protein